MSARNSNNSSKSAEHPERMVMYAELIRNYKNCLIKSKQDNTNWGFSEILACIGVRPFITTRYYRSVYTADSADHLSPTLTKCWTQLNWLNMNTNGGMKRSRQKIDNIWKKRASLLTPDATEFGRMSEIEGIVADDPNKVRGDRCERLIYEEAGSQKHLIKAWIQGNALVEVLGRKVGTRIAGGSQTFAANNWAKSVKSEMIIPR